jgi:REP element-mobilizing transposase RayT
VAFEPWPLAYLITFSTYGTRLHGDERGTVTRKNNEYGTPTVPASAVRLGVESERMNHEPFVMNTAQRTVAEATIQEVCRFRSWTILALNVRTNHIHVLVNAEATPEKVMGDLKSWMTRRLRERGLVRPGATLWTEHGSTRHLWKRRYVDAAWDYVVNGQGYELPREWPEEWDER